MIDDKIFSRREFLKLLGTTTASLALPAATPNSPDGGLSVGKLGRVATWNTTVRSGPYDKDKTVGFLKYDEILNLPDKIVEAKDNAGFTHYFYEFASDRYVNVGWIQEVKNHPNYKRQKPPETGCIGEICIPYTDVFIKPGGNRFRLKFYYAATFWVTDLVQDDAGKWYYEVLDDGSMHSSWYVPTRAIRFVSKEEVAPLSPDLDPALKHIEVDIHQQEVRAFEGKEQVFFAKVSTGYDITPTPLGEFATNRKKPTQRMHDLSGGPHSFDLPGVPWVSFFTLTGAAFHGAYWHQNWGFKMSNGCINMRPEDAKWIYRWTNPIVPFDTLELSSKEATAVKIIYS